MHFFSVCFLLKIRADSCDFHWLFYTLSLKEFSSKNVQILNNFVVLHHILNYFFLKVQTRQQLWRFDIGNQFRIEKEAIHKMEDPAYLDVLSDVFDCRLWEFNISESSGNVRCEKFRQFKNSLVKKLHEGAEFLAGVDLHQLDFQFRTSLDLICKRDLQVTRAYY